MTEDTTRSSMQLYDESKPVVCSIEATGVGDHIARLERLRRAATSIDRTSAGVLIRFPQAVGVTADVRRFVSEEMRCCQFWGFEVADDDDVALRWDGPPPTTGFMDRLVGYFEGTEPIGALFATPETDAQPTPGSPEVKQ